MRLRKENILWNVLLGTGVYLIDSLRDRLSNGFDDISDRARDTYGEASRRVSRASDVIRGEDHHGVNTAVALLLGVGVGVGVPHAYLTCKPLVSVPVPQEKVVAGPEELACTPLVSSLPLSEVRP